MTTQKRTLISPYDILSLGYECPHCLAVYTVPVSKLDRIITTCPNCQQRLLSDAEPSGGIQHSEANTLRHFAEFLKKLQTRDFGASIRFEIRGIPNEKGEST